MGFFGIFRSDWKLDLPFQPPLWCLQSRYMVDITHSIPKWTYPSSPPLRLLRDWNPQKLLARWHCICAGKQSFFWINLHTYTRTHSSPGKIQTISVLLYQTKFLSRNIVSYTNMSQMGIAELTDFRIKNLMLLIFDVWCCKLICCSFKKNVTNNRQNVISLWCHLSSIDTVLLTYTTPVFLYYVITK